MSSTTVEVNATESDALPLTLHEYGDNKSPVPVTVLNHSLVNGESVQTRFTIDESIVTTNCVSSEKNEPKSPRVSSSLALVVATSDYQQTPENDSVMEKGVQSSPVSSPVMSKRGKRGRNKWEGLSQNGVRRSPRLSTPTCPLIEGPKVKRIKSCVDKVNVEGGNESCRKLALTACNKKQSKGKRGTFFVGDPVSEHEALERWGWRYELKAKRRKGRGWILNAGEEDEVHVNVVCHYLQANVNGCIFSIGDCAHIKGEGKQQHVGRIVEFFKTSDDENYFRVQWFFRAEDTVMKKGAAFHDKKRLFFSTLMNDNLLECILSKVKIIEKPPMLGFQSTSLQPSDYYCDMEYSVKYSTFRSLATAKYNFIEIWQQHPQRVEPVARYRQFGSKM
ncbi:hypothetical protein QVD17_26909 [Tagetes erecta]|uniref:BAH domain-containing protein n=1 Tax=Tagetes erecta TaxID=13708 RepID=A0AAD8KDU5_TARER|nr:hypothetical protein QVD17_26909 [Tagetes erecta]